MAICCNPPQEKARRERAEAVLRQRAAWPGQSGMGGQWSDIKCDDSCPGWAVFETQHGFNVQACDECNTAAKRAGLSKLADQDAKELPAAKKEFRRHIREYGSAHVPRGEAALLEREVPEGNPRSVLTGPKWDAARAKLASSARKNPGRDPEPGDRAMIGPNEGDEDREEYAVAVGDRAIVLPDQEIGVVLKLPRIGDRSAPYVFRVLIGDDTRTIRGNLLRPVGTKNPSITPADFLRRRIDEGDPADVAVVGAHDVTLVEGLAIEVSGHGDNTRVLVEPWRGGDEDKWWPIEQIWIDGTDGPNSLETDVSRGVRKNPSPPKAAVDKYEEFHRYKPVDIGEFEGSFSIPSVMLEAGPAKWTTYRSGKVDPSTLKKPRRPVNYIHEHGAGVHVYLPSSLDARDLIGDADEIAVPPAFRDVEALVKLGESLGFCFTDDGEDMEFEGADPLPELYCTPDGKCLLVIQDKAEVLAMIWGAGLGVFARGIDG